MLKILERKIALQLLVFYSLFVTPLLLGGAELYFFQRDALQQNAQQADLGLAQAIAQNVGTYVQGAGEEAMDLARSQAATRLDLAQLVPLLIVSQQTHPAIGQYFVCDPAGKLLLAYPAHSADSGQNAPLCEFAQEGQISTQPFTVMGQIDQVTHTYLVSVAAPIPGAQNRPVGVMILALSLQQLNPYLLTVQQQLNSNGEVRIWIFDSHGTALLSTGKVSPATNLLERLPGLRRALQGQTGNLAATDERRDWLYSYVPVSGTAWAVAVGRPTDSTFATVISFQHSLVIALIMLLAGASVFWFVMHGWVVAPLGKLAQAVAMIKPDQAVKVTDSRLLAREKDRQDEIGRLVNAFSTMEDEIHTLFRKSDEQSYTRLQTLDALLSSMNEGVLLEDPAGQVVYANYRFTQFVGMVGPQMQQDAFQSKQLTERMEALVENLALYRQLLQCAAQRDGVQTIEFQVRGYYNQFGQLVPTRRDIRMSLFQVRDMAGYVIGRGKVMQDVTKQNEAEQVKKNLLAIISHELRTPLTAIKGYATSLLETDVDLDTITQRDFLHKIVEEEDRMADLVTGLLEMSQLEAGTLKLNPRLCHLDAPIKRVIETTRHGQLRVQVSLPPEVPLVYIDQRRMEIVLRNLLENAQKYAGDTARIEISVHLAQEPEESGIILDLADDGPGLPEELTERIFERFYQVDGSRERRSGGVGLGLAICRGFVEAHGGRIWAENRAEGGTGAIFHIWLPARLLHLPGTPSHTFKLETIF